MHYSPLLSYTWAILLFFNEECQATETDLEEVYGDEGAKLILPCESSDSSSKGGDVYWRRQWRNEEERERMNVSKNGSLLLNYLSRRDAGAYTCYLKDETVLNRVLVKVRTPPPALVNVTVIPSSILALIRWEVLDTGGYPILYFKAQYRLRHTPPDQAPDPWHAAIPAEISPTATQIDVYQLKPNTSYVFQIWANNKLGRGEVVELEAVTKHDSQEIELAKHLLDGAETFDTRIWVVAVAVVMGTLLVLASATVYLLYRECHVPFVSDKDMETMELIPNIILNPGYHDYVSSEWSEPDENSNDSVAVRVNNNTVINPIRL